MSAVLPDVYQDRLSAGSLVEARRHWIHLADTGILHRPHRFVFVFASPSPIMARGLETFLRYAEHAGFVRATNSAGTSGGEHEWRVVGTTRATVWSLSSLEHLFMALRGAGPRYESTLSAVDLARRVPRPA